MRYSDGVFRRLTKEPLCAKYDAADADCDSEEDRLWAESDGVLLERLRGRKLALIFDETGCVKSGCELLDLYPDHFVFRDEDGYVWEALRRYSLVGVGVK
jgi:hypothetical protein